MSKTYKLTINCRNCGLQFEMELPVGYDVRRRYGLPAYPLSYPNPKRSYESVVVRCPNCDSDNCEKAKGNWPWRKEHGD